MIIIGTHRYVIILGQFVFKFPRIRPLLYLYRMLKYRMFRSRSLFMSCILDGILENWREAKSSLCKRCKLLHPAFVPLVVVNVYHRVGGVGKFKIGMDESAQLLDGGFRNRDTDPQFWKAVNNCDCHTLGHANNFALENCEVLILDYGGRGVVELVEKYPDRIEAWLRSKIKNE